MVQLLAYLYQIAGDPPGQAPDGPALPGVDGDVLPPPLPLVAPGDADKLIGEVLRRGGDQLILIFVAGYPILTDFALEI